MTEENKLDLTAFNKKEQKLLNRLQREYKAKTLKELILIMAIELEPDICKRCLEPLITGIKMCAECNKAYVNEPDDIKEELAKLEEGNPVEFDVKGEVKGEALKTDVLTDILGNQNIYKKRETVK